MVITMMSDLPDFARCCRLCLSIKNDGIASVFDDTERNRALRERILAFLSIEIKLNDRLSTMVCDTCMNKINDWSEFKRTCFENQSTLERWAIDDKVSDLQTMSIQIKEEVIDDEIEVVHANLNKVKTEPMDYENNDESESAPFKCRTCNAEFENTTQLKDHEKEQHSAIQGATGGNVSKRTNPEQKIILPESDEEDVSTQPDYRVEADELRWTLLPEKSKDKYESVYQIFKTWRQSKGTESTSESTLLAFFGELSKTKAPTTLWSTFSMLKATLNVYENVRIGGYSKLISLLKKANSGFKSKKSSIFTAADIEKFLTEASDCVHLATKVTAIFCVNGACRTTELTRLDTKHIERHGDILLVKIPDANNQVLRSFTIEGELRRIVQKYIDLRSTKTTSTRFFLNFQNGKCTAQAIGKHKFERMPKLIAEYLGLKNPELYTGHSFRQVSADAGADIIIFKRRKSSAVTEGCVEESVQKKRKTISILPSTSAEYSYENIKEETFDQPEIVYIDDDEPEPDIKPSIALSTDQDEIFF